MKSGKLKIWLIILTTALLTGCELFTTRDPELPEAGRSNYVPPTSPSVVVSNFIAAIVEKNVENYIACLADTSSSDKYAFQFNPTADAFALYSSIFRNWNHYAERNYFNKLISTMPAEISPQISFQNTRFEILLPDSAVFVADYDLVVEHLTANVDTRFKGTLQFTIYPRDNGLWSIKTWYDLQNVQDTVKSWSFLKAQMAN